MPSKNVSKKKPNGQKNNESRSETDGQRISRAVTTVAHALTKQGEANRKQEKREDTGNKWLQWFTLGFVCLTTIGIFVQAYIFYGQQQTMQRQLNDFEIQESASLDIKNFSIQNFPAHPTVVYDISNSGHTRADQILPGIFSGTFLLKNETDLFLTAQPFAFSAPNINGFSLSPGEPSKHFSWVLTRPPFGPYPAGWPEEALKSAATLADILKGDKFGFYIMVDVPYLDVFGHPHQTYDCLIYRAQPKQFVPCTAQHDRHF
jgi:hypothetical protein